MHTANYRYLVPGVSVIKRLSLYKFVPEGRDFVSVVRIREVSVWRGSTVVFFLVQNEYHVAMTSQWFLF